MIVAPKPLITKAIGFVRAHDHHARQSVVSEVVSDRVLERERNVTPATRAGWWQPKRPRALPCGKSLRGRNVEVIRLVVIAIGIRLIERKGHTGMISTPSHDPTATGAQSRRTAFFTDYGRERIREPYEASRVLNPAGGVEAAYSDRS